jgi:hypothetical protein
MIITPAAPASIAESLTASADYADDLIDAVSHWLRIVKAEEKRLNSRRLV